MLLSPMETFIRFSMKSSQLKTQRKRGMARGEKGRKKGHTSLVLPYFSALYGTDSLLVIMLRGSTNEKRPNVPNK